MKSDQYWNTSISNIHPDSIEIRGYSLNDLIGNVTFAEQIFLVLTGELPLPSQSKMFEAVLCASIDHGAGTPSSLAARTAISGGATINGGVASGLLTMGEHHGAAVENCMSLLHEIVDKSLDSNLLDDFVNDSMKSYIEIGKQVPGVGHRIHPVDPRVTRLVDIATQTGFNGVFVSTIQKISRRLSDLKKKPLPVNIDGITAALLCEMKFPQRLGNVVFMVSRMVGIFAQACEEKETQKPMRHIDPICIEYKGIPARSFPKKEKND
ncbi:MAG: citryl-CoA lyase [Anaerolineaceae bacterium]|nr:citryl-CoA lyase [Anaerolineaceae bacterium]